MAALGQATPIFDSHLDLLTEMELEKKVEPNLGEIVKKIKALIEEKRVKDEELKELQEHRGAMEKQLDELNQEIFHLQSSCNTKEAHLKRLCFQYEQCQAQTERQLKASRESEQRIEELMTQIEGEKMKRRKERQEFEQQLEELIGKHKWMAEFYTPARLQLEMRNIENTKQQLLTEERMIMEKMSTLNKELDSVRQQGAASSEAIFLHSKEAKVTHQLFVEENKTVKELLRLAAENPLDPQQQALLRRFQEEWEPGRKVTNPDKNSDMEESKDGVQQEGHSKQRVQV